MWEGEGGQDGVEWEGEWDNCNSIINKYIKKTKKYKTTIRYYLRPIKMAIIKKTRNNKY